MWRCIKLSKSIISTSHTWFIKKIYVTKITHGWFATKGIRGKYFQTSLELSIFLFSTSTIIELFFPNLLIFANFYSKLLISTSLGNLNVFFLSHIEKQNKEEITHHLRVMHLIVSSQMVSFYLTQNLTT